MVGHVKRSSLPIDIADKNSKRQFPCHIIKPINTADKLVRIGGDLLILAADEVLSAGSGLSGRKQANASEPNFQPIDEGSQVSVAQLLYRKLSPHLLLSQTRENAYAKQVAVICNFDSLYTNMSKEQLPHYTLAFS